MNSEFSTDNVPPHTNTELTIRMAAYLTNINNLLWEIQSQSWGIHSLKGREELQKCIVNTLSKESSEWREQKVRKADTWK